MSKLPTAQEIIAEFRRRVILFCLLGIVAAHSFIVFMGLVTSGREGAILGIPVFARILPSAARQIPKVPPYLTLLRAYSSLYLWLLKN
jgi:hypothetical protein